MCQALFRFGTGPLVGSTLTGRVGSADRVNAEKHRYGNPFPVFVPLTGPQCECVTKR